MGTSKKCENYQQNDFPRLYFFRKGGDNLHVDLLLIRNGDFNDGKDFKEDFCCFAGVLFEYHIV